MTGTKTHEKNKKALLTGRRFTTHLSVELDGEDVVRVAVVANLCAFLKVIDVHPPWHGQADHHHQAAGEEPLHDVDVRALHCAGDTGGNWFELEGRSSMQKKNPSHKMYGMCFLLNVEFWDSFF